MAKAWIEGDCFADLAEKLEKAGGSVKRTVHKSFQQAGEKITNDTRAALSSGNLPAGGKYSTGKTSGTIVEPKVHWSGGIAEMDVGFNKSKPGAGGWLITGTPKMKPDYALQKIYKQKRYTNNLKKDIQKAFMDAIERAMRG